MKPKTAPTTVRLTPKATEDLINLEKKHPGIGRSALVEKALSEAMLATERVPMSDEESVYASFIFNYLIEVAVEHSTGPKKTVDGAREVALAAKSAARLLKRVFLEAKGRIVIAKT